ncbi:MAG: hypothetical protein OYG32_16960, partial [Rhodospirillaceae bacterium]|nr:hypothetical protein [Rhodospirillaceae bacterium]
MSDTGSCRGNLERGFPVTVSTFILPIREQHKIPGATPREDRKKTARRWGRAVLCVSDAAGLFAVAEQHQQHQEQVDEV